MPMLNETHHVSEAEAIAHLQGALEADYTRFSEGDVVRFNKRAVPQPGDRASLDAWEGTLSAPFEAVIPPPLVAVLHKGTVGVIWSYAGFGAWQGKREQDIYEVLVLGADGKTYRVDMPDSALLPHAPRDGEAQVTELNPSTLPGAAWGVSRETGFGGFIGQPASLDDLNVVVTSLTGRPRKQAAK